MGAVRAVIVDQWREVGIPPRGQWDVDSLYFWVRAEITAYLIGPFYSGRAGDYESEVVLSLKSPQLYDGFSHRCLHDSYPTVLLPLAQMTKVSLMKLQG